MDEKSWGDGVELGHAGAIEHLRLFLRERRGDVRLAAWATALLTAGEVL